MNNKMVKTVMAIVAIAVGGSIEANSQASGGGVAQTQPITVTCCSANGMTATLSGNCTCNLVVGNTISTNTATSSATPTEPTKSPTTTPTTAPTPTTEPTKTPTTTPSTTPTPSAPVTPRPVSTGSTENQSSIFDQLKEMGGGRARGDVVRITGARKGSLSTTTEGTIQVPKVGEVFEYQYGTITLVIGSFNLRGENKNATGILKQIIAVAAQDKRMNTMIWYGRRLPGSTEVVEIGESFTSATDLANTVVTYKPINKNSFSFTTPKNVGAQTFIVDLNPIIKQK